VCRSLCDNRADTKRSSLWCTDGFGCGHFFGIDGWRTAWGDIHSQVGNAECATIFSSCRGWIVRLDADSGIPPFLAEPICRRRNGSLFGITVGVGLLAQASRLTSGLLLIPSLYFLGGFSAMQAIGVSLSVVLLATLLPSLSAGRQPLPEPTYLTPSLFGGLIGGIAGGLGLLRLSDKGILIAFAVVAMYLCGQELTRIYYESLPSPQTTPEKEDNR
jgi:hypothetical protein